MSRQNGWVKTVSAFAIGIGVGAAVGILFAPKAGEEFRNDLADNAKQGLDQAKQGLDQAVSKGREWAGRAQQAAGDAVEQAKSQVRGAANEGEKSYREATNSGS